MEFLSAHDFLAEAFLHHGFMLEETQFYDEEDLFAEPGSSPGISPPQLDKTTAIASHRRMQASLQTLRASGLDLIAKPSRSSGNKTSCSRNVPLCKLRPMAFIELELEEDYPARVLFGTLCVDAFLASGIMTCLQDQSGYALRVCIYHTGCSSSSQAKQLFPNGTHIAIRWPLLSRSNDGCLLLTVHDPDKVEKLEKLPSVADWDASSVDPDQIFSEADLFFIEDRWEAALHCFSQCIVAATAKQSCSTSSKKHKKGSHPDTMIRALYARAKVYMKLKQYDMAISDCDRALEIDPKHTKSLSRKGKALHCVGKYEEACACFEAALLSHPGGPKNKRTKKMRAALEESKKCCPDNQQGEYSNLSRFLLGVSIGEGCLQFRDFVGSVVVKKASGRSGRGLFATENLKSGDVVIVSNAVAICRLKGFNSNAQPTGPGGEHHALQESLVLKISKMAMESPKLTELLKILVASPLQSSLEIPNMDIFRLSQCSEQPAASAPDANSIREIVKLNAFGNHHFSPLYGLQNHASKLVEYDDYYGLWLLPSFINHSCTPNASRLVVGDAMFVHAARDISAGEEITLTYFDSLIPLNQRELASKQWGFRCNCKRCAFERSMKKLLDPINLRFQSLHDKAKQEAKEYLSGGKSYSGALSHCSFLFNLAEVLAEVMVQPSSSRLSNEQHNWVTASYASVFLVGTLFELDYTTAIFVAKAMQSAVPGHIRTLLTFANLLEKAKIMKCDNLFMQPAMEACQSAFGKQEPHVLRGLIKLYSSISPFP